jgi:hypothetical protein
MTDLLHRTLRRLDHFAMTMFTPITPLGEYYQSLARRSPRG